MPIRIAVVALTLSLAAVALAQRPNLHDVVDRLIESDERASWSIQWVSEGFDDEPEDCELAIEHADLPLTMSFAGPRQSVRSATATIGPGELSDKRMRMAMKVACEALGSSGDILPATVQQWLMDHRETLREGGAGKPTNVPRGRLSGASYRSDEGLVISVNRSWDEAKASRPASGLGRIEHSVRESGFWPTDVSRVYHHNTGITLSFYGGDDPRMVIECDGDNTEQASLLGSTLLLVYGITGRNADWDPNSTAVANWLKSPREELKIRGATLQFDVKADTNVLITIRESD